MGSIPTRPTSRTSFSEWAEEEDEATASPMARMKPPKVPVQPPDVISGDDLSTLLAACDTPRGGPGRATPKDTERLRFENKRDRAMILMLVTTGIRSVELMGLIRESVDLAAGRPDITELDRVPRRRSPVKDSIAPTGSIAGRRVRTVGRSSLAHRRARQSRRPRARTPNGRRRQP